MPEVTLLPCPACGNPDAVVSVTTRAAVYCPMCGMCGPCSPKVDAEYAIRQWNSIPRALEWTDEPPKVPGWYWCRDENDKENARIIFPNIRKTKWRDKQWAGPIPEPKEQGGHDG